MRVLRLRMMIVCLVIRIVDDACLTSGGERLLLCCSTTLQAYNVRLRSTYRAAHGRIHEA